MNEIKLGLDKSKKYIVACSYGPDSMALLSACINEKLDIVVAHVNYHKRTVSNFEQESLVKFCKGKNVKVEVLDTTGMEPNKNFQEWARELRYNFFAEIVKKYNADYVLVAHQEDDLIETYLMQKNRKNYVKYEGIARENRIFGINILRPLLSYSKQYLLDYDNQRSVPYSVDESNLTDHYARNVVRHHKVELMTEKERKEIVELCKNQSQHFLAVKTNYELEEFLSLSYEGILHIFDYFMDKLKEHNDISHGFVKEIKKAFSSNKNVNFILTKSLSLESNYGFVSFVNLQKIRDYSFEFTNKLNNEMFDIDFSKGATDRGINASEILVVKNLNKNDKYKINNYRCDIKRLFIDWKMPSFLRKVWPGIYNLSGELIYIPRYRKENVDNNKSKFVFKTEIFQQF